MFKFLFISLLIYLGYKVIKAFLKGFFIIRQIPRQNSQGQNEPNPFANREIQREKDISDKVRVLEEDKKSE